MKNRFKVGDVVEIKLTNWFLPSQDKLTGVVKYVPDDSNCFYNVDFGGRIGMQPFADDELEYHKSTVVYNILKDI